MNLLTPDQLKQLIGNGFAQRAREEQGLESIDFTPLVKLFTPDANATWLITEADSDDPDRLFGLCDLGLGFPELGYVSLTELTNVRGPFGLAVERDVSFISNQLLSDYAREARVAGRVVA